MEKKINLDKLKKELGITDIEAYVRELTAFEKYVSNNFPQVSDEAWSNMMND